MVEETPEDVEVRPSFRLRSGAGEIAEFEGKYVVGIHPAVLPPVRKETKVVEETIPGYPIETVTDYPVLVRPYGTRVALLLKPMIEADEEMTLRGMGFDNYSMIEVRLLGTDMWLSAHLRHKGYTRVWVPPDIVKKTDLRKHHIYPVFIRGMSIPKIYTTEKVIEIRDVVIKHLDKTYKGKQVRGRYYWEISPDINCYSAVDLAMKDRKNGVTVFFHQNPDLTINVEFFFRNPQKVIQERGFCWRYQAVRNYDVTRPDELGYGFNAELRATYLSPCRRLMYQNKEGQYALIIDTLGATVELMQKFFFTSIQHACKSEDIFYEHWGEDIVIIGTIEGDRELRKGGRIKITRGGSGVHPDHDRELFRDHREDDFQYCLKYARIEDRTKTRSRGNMYVKHTSFIDDMLNKSKFIVLDEQGIIWKTY